MPNYRIEYTISTEATSLDDVATQTGDDAGDAEYKFLRDRSKSLGDDEDVTVQTVEKDDD